MSPCEVVPAVLIRYSMYGRIHESLFWNNLYSNCTGVALKAFGEQALPDPLNHQWW